MALDVEGVLSLAKGLQTIVDDAGMGWPPTPPERSVGLEVLDGQDMTLGGMVVYSTTSLRILTPLTWEQAEVLAHMLQGEYIFSHRQLPWYVGDMLNWADSAFGEAYPQLILDALSDYEKNTLRNWKFVSAAVPQHLRRENLFHSVHAEVASLATDDEKRYWLDQTTKNGWSRDALRKAIRDSKITEPEGGNETPMPDVAPIMEQPLQLPLMVNILGLSQLSDTSALRKIKAEALPALAQFVPDKTPGSKKAELALFTAVDKMLEDWYEEMQND